MADGLWTLSDEGEFTLVEPYATMLYEAKVEATKGWADGLISYLAPRVSYDPQYMIEVLCDRQRRNPDAPSVEILESFVLEALSGDL